MPKPGEVLCEHKDDGEPHFAHGLCKKCFDEVFLILNLFYPVSLYSPFLFLHNSWTCFLQLNEISGGLEGGADPPAFQRAERQRMEKEKAQEKITESCVVSD